MAYDDNQGIEKEMELEDRSKVTRRESYRPEPVGCGTLAIAFAPWIGLIVLILAALYGVYTWLH